MSILSVENLERHFGGLAAVSAVSFAVDENEILSIIGPNGAGKTTILNVIAGMLKPSGGKVIFNGLNVASFDAHQLARLGIARTFQVTRLFKHLTVLDNVRIGMHARTSMTLLDEILGTGRKKSEESRLVERARELMGEFKVLHCEDEMAGNLAYGTQRVVEIVRALASNPKILLLDEPAAGMNHGEVRDLMDLVGKIRDKGLTVILIEHNMDIVMGISDHVVVVDHGKKIADGKPSQVQSDPNVIEAYLGRGAARDVGSN